MRKFWAYFKTFLSDAFVYRATGIIWLLNDIGPALVMIIFWMAAFKTKESISGYNLSSITFYYFGIAGINSLVTTHPHYILADEIRTGAFSNYLVKPIQLAANKLAAGLAWRFIRILFFIPAIIILWHLMSIKLPTLNLSFITLFIFFISLILSLLITFYIKMILGLSAIWFIESGWLFISFEIISGFFSGELIPLDLFPSSVIAVNNFLPFKYMIYFPLTLILNRVTLIQDQIFGLLIGLGWVIFFYLLYRLVLKKGIKNYCAFGG